MKAKEWLINKYPEMEANWQQTAQDDNWTASRMDEFAEYKVNLLNKPAVIGRSEQFICPDCNKPEKEYKDGLCEMCHKWHTS